MTRSTILRLAALAGGIVLVASCDTALPTAGTNPTGGGSSSSSSGSGSNNKKPTISIDSPVVGTLVNLGDSVFVTLHLHDNVGLKSATLSGVTQIGSIDLGTFKQTERYKGLTIPVSGSFRAGLRDTTIRRYLQPADLKDTTLGSMVVVATVVSDGGSDTASRNVDIVTGPKVMIVAPANGDSIPAGVGLSVSARATHPDGISRVDIRVRGETSWPTKLDTTVSQVYTNASRDVTFAQTVRIPIDAPVRSRVTITATAVDLNRQPGSAAPVAIFVRSANAAQPRVTQTVALKSEAGDSVQVRATGDNITMLGLIIRDSTGTMIQADTLHLSAPFTANAQAMVPLAVPPSQQGRRLGITAFAIDQAGRIGYAVPLSRASGEGNLSNAVIDSTLLVYGHTYPLPHPGNIGDITVDAARGHAFVSATAFNSVDVWQSSVSGKGFAPTSIPVGSLPWGMFIGNRSDTLLVANSGGTNISRVYIGSTDASGMHEDLASRILTRNTYVYVVHVQRDPTSGKVVLKVDGPISYSDRPQYLAQSKGGRVYYSTRPTPTAPSGTMRWLDPSLPVPDPRQIWQYGDRINSEETIYALFNVDSVAVGKALPNSTRSDTLFMWDHPYGQKTGTIVVADTIPLNAISTAVAGGSDAEAVLGLDVNSLALTDTTFVTAAGNRQWVAFGEGNTGAAGRVVMVADSTGPVPQFFSPLVTIADFTDNASEHVFGLAMDLNGLTVAAHGLQSYFGAVSDPFHLRLQGKFDSFDDGAGIAFHPQASGVLTPQDQRLAFVGAASGMIEIVDIAYYTLRGKLPLKNKIYGPLRASLPMPGDDPSVILKLFAVTQQGLVVVDLTANDIKPGPP
jgi:hypothetical protein